MKKHMILAAVLCAAVTAARGADTDTYLYWKVDVSDNDAYAFSYATIKAKDSDGNMSSYLSLYGSGDSPSSATHLYGKNDSGNLTAGPIYAGIGDYIGSTFLVELWASGSATDGSDATRVAWGSLAYSTLLDNGSIYTQMGQSGNNVYTVTASQVVPEPTSGLLALIGLAALALRRKQTGAAA